MLSPRDLLLKYGILDKDICVRKDMIKGIEIINNTRGGIVIFFTEKKKGTRFLGGKFKSQMQGQALIG